MTENLGALKASKNWLEFFGNKEPKCPHCGAAYDITYHEAWRLYDDNGSHHDVTCGSCKLDFQVISQANWSFSTDEQEQPA